MNEVTRAVQLNPFNGPEHIQLTEALHECEKPVFDQEGNLPLRNIQTFSSLLQKNNRENLAGYNPAPLFI